VILVYSLRKKWITIARKGKILIRLSPEGKVAEVGNVMWKNPSILEFEAYFHAFYDYNYRAWEKINLHLSLEEKSIKIFIPTTLSLYSSKEELNNSDWEEIVEKIIKKGGEAKFINFFRKKLWEGVEKSQEEIMEEIKKFHEKLIDKEVMKQNILEILQKNLKNVFNLSFIDKAEISIGEPTFEASLILN
jgi:hypothetical protein